MNLFNNKISINTLLFDGYFVQKDEFIIQKNQIKVGIALFACAVGFYLMAYNTPAKQQWCLSVNIVIVD